MKTFLLTLFVIATSSLSNAAEVKCQRKPIVVAVIDSGFGYKGLGKGARLCNFGHKDFSGVNKFSIGYGTIDPIPTDTLGHGTNVAGIIDEEAKKSSEDYCLVIIKYIEPDNNKHPKNLINETKAIDYAIKLNVDFINLSGGGYQYFRPEENSVQYFLDKGGYFISAAGNYNTSLDEESYYPAMDDPRVIVVGSLSPNIDKAKISNYGSRVDVWEIGEKVTAYGITMTGTSQATAVFTGKMLARTKNKCYKHKVSNVRLQKEKR